MRNLRWAGELAVSNDAAKALLGVRELEALRDSKILTPVELEFVIAALKVTIEVPLQAIAGSAGDVDVVLEAGANASDGTLVSSGGDQGEEADI